MGKMYKGCYVGPVEHLQGKEALIQPDPLLEVEMSTMGVPWLAQFDDTTLMRDGKRLAYGWHLFERDEFEALYELGGEKLIPT